ncbi:hypothetical protein GQX74_013708 [Glossina fuscipes]|nr:hypothetical protein GQX74_013708 [Glossina fuscipes]
MNSSLQYVRNLFDEYFCNTTTTTCSKTPTRTLISNPRVQKNHTKVIRVTFGRLRVDANTNKAVTQPFGASQKSLLPALYSGIVFMHTAPEEILHTSTIAEDL